jgi:hypothetical protein
MWNDKKSLNLSKLCLLLFMSGLIGTIVFVAIAAAFMGLIVRVVKNVLAKAVELQTEVDYTI